VLKRILAVGILNVCMQTLIVAQVQPGGGGGTGTVGPTGPAGTNGTNGTNGTPQNLQLNGTAKPAENTWNLLSPFTVTDNSGVAENIGVATATNAAPGVVQLAAGQSSSTLAPSATIDTTNASNITYGTLPVGQLPATAVQTNQSNTYTSGTQDFSAATAIRLPTGPTQPLTSGGSSIAANTLLTENSSGTYSTATAGSSGCSAIVASAAAGANSSFPASMVGTVVSVVTGSTGSTAQHLAGCDAITGGDANDLGTSFPTSIPSTTRIIGQYQNTVAAGSVALMRLWPEGVYGQRFTYVAYSITTGAAPALTASNGVIQTITLSVNATPTVSGIAIGQHLVFEICQPSSGGPYTWTWPSSIHGGVTIGTTANTCSVQAFDSFNGTTLVAESPGVTGVAP
jgi:hypothetical protein